MEIIEFQGNPSPATYLGDGVYAIFDGFGIWLYANDHRNPTDKIYLKPEVLNGLIDFNKEARSSEVVELIKLRMKGERDGT